MQPVNTDLGILNIATGVLLALVCLPLLFDRIGPNRWYGVRIPKSFESRDNWFTLNRYGARAMIAWSGVLILCGLVLLFVPIDKSQSTLVMLLSLLPVVAIWTAFVQILRYAKKL